MSDVTHILDRVQQGDPKAAGELLPLVYDKLRRLAAAKIAQQAPGQTLQATSWSMKRTCASPAERVINGRIARISSAPQPKRCAAS
jgi:hypothetical protein